MAGSREFSRRSLLSVMPATGLSVAVSVLGLAQKKDEEEEDVTPAEDLMREHGVLKRVLLVYDEVIARIAQQKDFPPKTITDSAQIIRSFIEQYHEKLEEDYLFPRFRKHGLLVDLVDTLQQQHEAGRRVTAQILVLSGAGLKSSDDKRKLSALLSQFVRMYAPHEAREDTVLFPTLHRVVTRHEYDALGEDFEKKEHQLFGKEGFEGMVERVGGIEKQLGIYDLSQFTPR